MRELEEEWAVAPERVQGEALLRLPHQLVMFVGQAWLAEGADERVRPDHEHDAYAWWPARDRRLARRGRRGAAADGPLAVDVSERRARARRAAHLHAPAGGLLHPLLRLRSRCCSARSRAAARSRETFVLGLTHGLMWIGMSLACLAAARLRIVSLRLAVAVAVLGGIGPFFGSYEFIREQRRDAPGPPTAPAEPRGAPSAL